MKKKIRIEAKVSSLRIVEKAIDEATNELGIRQDNYGKILVSILEGVNNAIVHGNKSNPDKFVDIELRFVDNVLKVKITDQGNGFIPGRVPDPTTPENLETPNGRGVFLMSRLADKIEFNKKGNAVTMTFKNIVS